MIYVNNNVFSWVEDNVSIYTIKNIFSYNGIEKNVYYMDQKTLNFKSQDN